MSENETQEQEVGSTEQPLIAHLVELRDRLIRCFIVIVIFFLCIFPFGNELYEFIAKPLQDVLPEGSSMIATSPTSPFMIPFKTSIYAAIFIGVPVILHQAWAFIAPGLYKNEIRVAFPILISSIILFYFGISFAYFLVFKFVIPFFVNSAPDSVQVMTDITEYLDFALALFLVFGLVLKYPLPHCSLFFPASQRRKTVRKKTICHHWLLRGRHVPDSTGSSIAIFCCDTDVVAFRTGNFCRKDSSQ